MLKTDLNKIPRNLDNVSNMMVLAKI